MGMPEAKELLYHYTSEAGLRGIIESDHIWATHIRFLNDWTEFTHVFNEESLAAFVETFISALPTDIDSDARRGKIDGVLSKRNYPRLLETIESSPFGEPKEAFVCSFTADEESGGNPGDRLSQWRGYSHGSQGFSLGFDRALLKRQIETQNNYDGATAELAQCIYDQGAKHATLIDMGRAAAVVAEVYPALWHTVSRLRIAIPINRTRIQLPRGCVALTVMVPCQASSIHT
jgi:hypothetical protein